MVDLIQDEEWDAIQNYDGAPENLDTAEYFLYHLKDIFNLRKRLELWLFKHLFNEKYTDEKEKVALFQTAHKNIKFSHFVFHFILFF